MFFVAVVRWSARILSGLIVLFFGFFLVAHLIGDQGRASRPLAWSDYVILVTVVVSLVGLLLAWKWEFAGAAIALIAILVCAVVNWRVLVFPGALIPITSVLYFLSWWIDYSNLSRGNTIQIGPSTLAD
jgi:hypothetical protein